MFRDGMQIQSLEEEAQITAFAFVHQGGCQHCTQLLVMLDRNDDLFFKTRGHYWACGHSFMLSKMIY